MVILMCSLVMKISFILHLFLIMENTGMQKSDLIKCLKLTEESNKKDFDCKIFDGAALIHMLKPNAVKSFQEYAEEVFVKFIQQQL